MGLPIILQFSALLTDCRDYTDIFKWKAEIINNNWIRYDIQNSVELFFHLKNNKLFRITTLDNYQGKLFEKIGVGTTEKELLKVEHNKNWWNENMDIKQLEKYFNRAESSIRKAIKKMCDKGFSNYKYLDNNKVIISGKGVEWICKNVFKQKYLELLEKYKMELTELYIKAGYPYDHFFHRN